MKQFVSVGKILRRLQGKIERLKEHRREGRGLHGAVGNGSTLKTVAKSFNYLPIEGRFVLTIFTDYAEKGWHERTDSVGTTVAAVAQQFDKFGRQLIGDLDDCFVHV